jgi:hypothetical protein
MLKSKIIYWESWRWLQNKKTKEQQALEAKVFGNEDIWIHIKSFIWGNDVKCCACSRLGRDTRQQVFPVAQRNKNFSKFFHVRNGIIVNGRFCTWTKYCINHYNYFNETKEDECICM